jgi:protein-L-isoaspartate(D-aspartate) O-methyltransferase
MVDAPDPADAARLRRELVATVRERAGAVTEPVARALSTVPRHVFLPEITVAEAYRDEAIAIKWDESGVPISSSSQPTIMAIMLDQLDVAPGQRILEIGAGTGYNAALLAHLVGPTGRVVSVDIDADTVNRARAALTSAGCPGVTVVLADGADGYSAGAPYDRIIATARAWDLAPAWRDQLAPGGRIVVPLDLRGSQVTIIFERDGQRWVGRSAISCGFMRLRGADAGPDQLLILDRAAQLRLGVPDARPVNVSGVRAGLDASPIVETIDIAGTVGESLSGLSLWLAVTDSRSCVLVDDGAADEDGAAGASTRAATAVLGPALLAGPGFRASPCLVDGASVALLGRPDAASQRLLATYGYGPAGASLAAELAARARQWHMAGRPHADRLTVLAIPRDLPADVPPDAILIDKRHTRLIATFTPPRS